MIKKYFIPIILLLGFGFSSCDSEDLESVLPAIDIDISEKAEIPVFVDKTNGDWVDFSQTTTISIDNGSTNKYLNKIKKIKINKLRYKVISFIGDSNGEVKGTFSADGGPPMMNGFTVNSAHVNGTIYEVTDTAELTRIANALKSKYTIQIAYSGEALCDQDNMDFIIEVELLAVVNVDP